MIPSELSLLQKYARLITDWWSFTEEKWRAINDSQLGRKPVRGRCNGWDEILVDSYGADDPTVLTSSDPMARRFEHSQSQGSAASAVACFLRDRYQVRQAIRLIADGAPPQLGEISQREAYRHERPMDKPPIIRNPMIVDAD
jgi:hypothetical protein